MSKKRPYHEMSGTPTSTAHPPITKRQKTSLPNGYVRNQNDLEFENDEDDAMNVTFLSNAFVSQFISNAMNMSCDSDSDSMHSSITSVVESMASPRKPKDNANAAKICADTIAKVHEQSTISPMDSLRKTMSDAVVTLGCISVFLLMLLLALLFAEALGLLGIFSVICGWPCWCTLCLCIPNRYSATNNNQRRDHQEHQYLLNTNQNGREM